MQTSIRRFTGPFVVIAAVVVLIAPGIAPAQSGPPVSRLPRNMNAILTIDVAKLIQSPMGKQMELQSKLMNGYADRPLPVPATARRLTVAAAAHPMGMQAIYQVAVIDLASAPHLESINRAQGGFLDTIGGRDAAWTKHDVYYVLLDDHTLGVVRPGQRQFVCQWVAKKDKAELSPYLTSAMGAAASADAVFAVDLEGVVGVPGLTYALAMGDLPSLDKMPSGRLKLFEAIASVKGMNIVMRATDHLEAEWTIDFGQSVAALGTNAKAFVVDVLNAAGLGDAAAEKWDFRVVENKIVGTGPMDLEGLRRLVALFAPGDMAPGEGAAADGRNTAAAPAPAPAGAADAAQPAADPQKAIAAASLKYYKAIAKSLDSFAGKPSPTQGATWLHAQAKMIQQLPILNVDPALLDWGNAVTETFNKAAQEMALGQQKATNSAASVATPTGYSSYDGAGDQGTDTPETRAAFNNAQQQRRQLSQSERQAAAERAFGYFNQIQPMRGQIRAQMTQKYGVEF